MGSSTGAFRVRRDKNPHRYLSRTRRLLRRLRRRSRRAPFYRRSRLPTQAVPSASRPALTGIVGLKPTYGAVSRSGLIAMGSSLDQIGPLAKSVADARILYDAICGIDSLDSRPFQTGLYGQHKLPKNLRIGVPCRLLQEGVDTDVLTAFDVMLETARACRTYAR